MSQNSEVTFSVMKEWPGDRQTTVDDFATMLEELSGHPYDPADVEANLDRVFLSPHAYPIVGQTEHGRKAATATLSAIPVLSGNGLRLWIDDVVTHPEYQNRGLFKRAMTEAESLASTLGSEVYLTSSKSENRDKARGLYVKGGYVCLNEAEKPQVIYRNEEVGKIALADTDTELDVSAMNSDFTTHDVWEIASLLQEDPAVVEKNLAGALQSPTTQVFAKRNSNKQIVGVAIGSETLLAVGKKPWINNIAGKTRKDILAVVRATGEWLGSNYKHVNITAPDHLNFGEGWRVRPSNLYVKQLGGLAIA